MWLLDQIYEVESTTRPTRGLPHVATALLVSAPVDGRAVVRLYDGDPTSVPAQPGVYDGITTVSVQVDGQGRPVLVYGPTTPAPVAAPQEPPVAAEPPPDSPEVETGRTRTLSRTVQVTDSGTWSVRFSSWGSWGGSWKGHPYSAGQDEIFNSGTLLGAGFYGSQVKGLGATTITRARLRIIGADQGWGWTPKVRLCTNGSKPSGAPAYASTDVATGPSLAYDADGWVDLTSAQRELLRTGAARGVVLVGDTYGVTRGKGTSGLSLALTYEVPA